MGTASVAAYPGNPLTVRPAVWLSSRRSVTFSVVVNSLPGSFQETSFALTSSSSDSRPPWTRRSAAIAATGLLIDAAWKRVRGVARSGAPAFSTPYARAHSIAPSFRTATLTAGVWRARMRSSMVSACGGPPLTTIPGTR